MIFGDAYLGPILDLLMTIPHAGICRKRVTQLFIGLLATVVFEYTNAAQLTFYSWEPVFGGDFHVVDATGINSIVGAEENTLKSSTVAFPTGVTGYGRTNNFGNQVFGIFGHADLYNTGVATNEFDSFNYAALPNLAIWPPKLSIGTTDYNTIAAQLVAYGSYASKVGLNIAYGSQPFLSGIYMHPTSTSHYGLFIDADGAHGAIMPALIRSTPNHINITLQTIGMEIPNNAIFQVLDKNGNVKMAIKQNGAISPSETAGIVGTSTNNLANAGSVGEIVFSRVGKDSAKSLTSGFTSNVTRITLTSGDWDCRGWGQCYSYC